MATHSLHYQTVRKRVSALKPSPENLAIYAPVKQDDPEIVKLAKSIKAEGLHEPISITQDGYIVSGHRRHAACQVIGQKQVPCRVLPFKRSDMTADEFICVLRDHNRQRYKSCAEQLKEELLDTDPAEAHKRLRFLRDKTVDRLGAQHPEKLNIEGEKRRCEISADKAQHVEHILRVVNEDRRDYWPLTVRMVHYPLLNYDFFRNVKKRLKYKNDTKSYSATSDLITRMRLSGEIPWHAFEDPTRPLKDFNAFSDVRQFARLEVERLFAGYWRDLLQTQPNHVEVLVEKNTVYTPTLRITKQFQIPTSSARGFSSIDSLYQLHERYQDSGKERLVVIVLSDFDPEGEQIPLNIGRTLRDDFCVDADDLEIIKAGVTREQIERYTLKPMTFAKESSSNFDWFVERNGGDRSVYELEALDPADMLSDLEAVIKGVLDMELFNAEAEREQEEAAYLDALRKTAAKALQDAVE